MIPDAHSHADFSNDRFDTLGKFAADLQPDIVVNIGDWFDMPSLCSYDKGTRGFEGRRFWKDLEHGIDAQERFVHFLRRRKRKLPRFVALEGNHEYRLTKAINHDPVMLEGIPTDFGFKDRGWEYFPYNGSTPAIVSIEGINFAHYITTAGTDRAVSAEHQSYNVLQRSMVSTVVGHKHIADWTRRVDGNGKTIQAICAGWFGDYIPNYAGESAKHWWSGVVVLDQVDGTGYFEHRFISLRTLEKEYSDGSR